MPIKAFDENGEEIEVYSKDEVTPILTEKEKLAAEIAAKEEKIQEQGRNLTGLRQKYEVETKRLADMSEEDKAKLSEAQISLMKRTEELEDAKRREHDSKRNRILEEMSQGDEKLRKEIDKHYGLINLPEETEEEIMQRARYARQNASLDLGLVSEGPGIGAGLGGGSRVPNAGIKPAASTERQKAIDTALFGDILGNN
jgi:Skp family chaperone for outer membrane proteins